MSNDLRPQIGSGGGSQTRIGFEDSPHELEWPSAAGDCGPVDQFGHEIRGGYAPALVVWDAKGRVILEILE